MNKYFVTLIVVFFTIPNMLLFSQSKPDAVAEYRRGNWEAALNICKQDLAMDPDNIEAYVVLCWSLVKLGRYEEARRYAEAAHDLKRYDVRIVEIFGEINYQQGRNNEALQNFQEYVNLAPDGQRVDVAYYYMGEIYIRLGRFRHADIALSTALHYMPTNAAWWTRLAYSRENAGELMEAVIAYQKAISLNAQLADAMYGLNRVRTTLANRR